MTRAIPPVISPPGDAIDARAETLRDLYAQIRTRPDEPPPTEAADWVMHYDQDTGRPTWASKAELEAFWAVRLPT